MAGNLAYQYNQQGISGQAGQGPAVRQTLGASILAKIERLDSALQGLNRLSEATRSKMIGDLPLADPRISSIEKSSGSFFPNLDSRLQAMINMANDAANHLEAVHSELFQN